MSVFVGREQDLETLAAAVRNAVQGRGSVAFVSGEAGIGKTTFSKAFKAW